MKKRIIVLGCTGSIGQSTLELAREFPDLFEVVGLQANSNEAKLLELGKEFNCTQLCLTGKNIGAEVSVVPAGRGVVGGTKRETPCGRYFASRFIRLW